MTPGGPVSSATVPRPRSLCEEAHGSGEGFAGDFGDLEGDVGDFGDFGDLEGDLGVAGEVGAAFAGEDSFVLEVIMLTADAPRARARLAELARCSRPKQVWTVWHFADFFA